MNSIKEIA